MKLLQPNVDLMAMRDGGDILRAIERAGRVCYKSEHNVSDSSAARFAKMIVRRGHLSVIEHESATVKFTIDRGVSHELVRHRLASFSQESTRYVRYGTRGNHIQFVLPPWVGISPGVYSEPSLYGASEPDLIWYRACLNAEANYLQLLNAGWKPEAARSVLPNSLKTEIVVTANLRQWRHIFTLRCDDAAHPQMRQVMRPTLALFRQHVPVLFDDLPDL